MWLGRIADVLNIPPSIKHVLTVASYLKVKVPYFVKHHTQVNIDDQDCDDILKILPKALKAIDRGMSSPSSSIFVHCSSGLSRSPTTIIAWLMTRRNMSMNGALELVRSVRPKVNPNVGFLVQLRALEYSKGNIKEASLNIRNSKRSLT